MRQRTSRAGNSSSGFTLLEMLVVITIVVMLAATLPNLRFGKGQSHEEAVREILSTLRQARAEAIRNAETTPVVFDLRERRFGMPGQEKELAASINLTLRTAREVRTSRGEQSIVFFPDGSASGGTIRVERGREISTINVRWLTGVIRQVGQEG